jgi:uncharacterized paraquat-inducible protein A
MEALAQHHHAGPREGTWVCHECDALNSEIDVTCGSCGARSNSTQALAQHYHAGPREGTWVCHECDALNSEIDVTCGSCGARGDGTQAKSLEGYGTG